MKFQLIRLVTAAMLLFPLATFGEEAAGKQPPLLIASYSNSAAYLVSPSGEVIWKSEKMPGPCQDAWLLPNNHVLLSGGTQVREITVDQKVVWQYEAPKEAKVEIHNCQPLPGGGALIGEGGTCRLLEIDTQGKIAKETRFAYSAGCLRLPNGNTVVAAYTSKFPIFEVTPDKQVVWKFQNPAVGNPTHVKVLTPEAVEKFLKSTGK